MNKTIKKVDIFNNIHYLDLVKIEDDKLENLKKSYTKAKLNEIDIEELFVASDDGYVDVTPANIKNIIDPPLDIDDVEPVRLYEPNIIGKGGQGIVYKTRNADTVIKIALQDEKPITDENTIKQFHQKIQKLIFKPLPQDINIAKPLVVLKNEAGYVMNLLDGMKPFSTLLPQELSKEKAMKLVIPDFLKEIDNRSAIYFTHYLETGGLRKRLYTLSRLAITLYRLHSRGLVYFDISHNNVFLNNDDIPLVYLIDADNIEYDSINKNTVYTPNFEVPEVVKGEPNSIYSDIYAFGILAYMALTTNHPFDGIGQEESDWDSEDTVQKERWELPWVEDSSDDSNKSKSGLKGKLTITEELHFLFHKLFEEGKNDKFQRPTLPLWIESLEKAASKTLLCSQCKMSYYSDEFEVCPYCEAIKPKRLVVDSYYYKNNEKLQKRWRFIKEVTEKTRKIDLPKYLFQCFDILHIDDTYAEVKFPSKTRVEFSFNKGDENIYFESKKPIALLNKRIGLNKLEDGISVIVEGSITTLVEIKIEQ